MADIGKLSELDAELTGLKTTLYGLQSTLESAGFGIDKPVDITNKEAFPDGKTNLEGEPNGKNYIPFNNDER